MRAIPPTMDPAIVAHIDQHLIDIAQDKRVEILIAIESGSRAWGFPSPDSDYDCRFIYKRRLPDYLALFPHRDVLESSPHPVFDVGGWDLAKAMKLLLKGNAVVVEWLVSPIVYRGDARVRDQLLALADKVVRRDQLYRHYFHLGISKRNSYSGDGEPIKLKKAFYSLRPALALRWMARHPEQTFPPMHFPTLMAQSGVPASLTGIVDDLLAEKAKTREMGTGLLPRELVEFIDREFALARENWPPEERLDPVAVAAADALFQEMVTPSQTAPVSFP